jgi:hypothetical protein
MIKMRNYFAAKAKKIVFAGLIGIILNQCGCAVLLTKSEYHIPLNCNVPSDASLYNYKGKEIWTGRTPTSVPINRNKNPEDPLIAVIGEYSLIVRPVDRSIPGQSKKIMYKITPKIWLNVLNGGVGFIVDGILNGGRVYDETPLNFYFEDKSDFAKLYSNDAPKKDSSSVVATPSASEKVPEEFKQKINKLEALKKAGYISEKEYSEEKSKLIQGYYK